MNILHLVLDIFIAFVVLQTTQNKARYKHPIDKKLDCLTRLRVKTLLTLDTYVVRFYLIPKYCAVAIKICAHNKPTENVIFFPKNVAHDISLKECPKQYSDQTVNSVTYVTELNCSVLRYIIMNHVAEYTDILRLWKDIELRAPSQPDLVKATWLNATLCKPAFWYIWP